MRDLLLKLEDFALNWLKALHPALGVAHMRVTLALAREIAAGEQIDSDLCAACAILHDVALGDKIDFEHETVDENHGTRSAAMARALLLENGLSAAKVDLICDAVASHCFPGNQKTAPARVLWDADKLNLFSPEMYPHYLSSWQESGLSVAAAEKRIADARHFYYPKFYTDTARGMADDSGYSTGA